MPKENFNLQENTVLREGLEDFSLSSGINSFAVNTKGKLVLSYQAFCPLSKHQFPECKECEQHFRYGCFHSSYLRGQFQFFCPVGLLFLISPVGVGNKLEGAAVAGPLLTRDFKEIEPLGSHRKAEMTRAIQTIPVVKPERVFALSKTLYYHISYAFEYILPGGAKAFSLFDALLSNFKNLLANQKGLICFSRIREKELIGFIEKGERGKAEQKIHMILDYFYVVCDGNFDMYRIHMLEYLMFLSYIASKNNTAPEQIFGMNYSSLNLLREIRNMEQLQDWLEGVLQHFFDCVFAQSQVKHVNIIYNAIQYVQKNYNQKIYLEDVAGMIYLNPSYFSRVFKDEMGVTFHSYLTNYRIEMSKKFLLDPSIPILSVASLVGFDDQSYFTKVFKRKNGVTPKVFRSRN